MVNEWSADSADAPGDAVSATPRSPGTVTVAGGTAAVSTMASDADGVAPDGPDVEAAAASDEESHRSAVDAVDGLLDEVELALARLDDGTYGRCEACGAPIDDDRLAALPIVRTCERCDDVDGAPVAEADDSSISA